MYKEYRSDIYDSLLEYVQDERYNQAVLIDGDWGSGKTWFIKNVFIPQMKKVDSNKWHIVYVSLYGMHSIDQLAKKLNDLLVQDVLKKWLYKSGNVPDALSGKGDVIKSVLKSAASLIRGCTPMKDLSINDIISAIPKPNHIIYIMDDLERTDIKAKELLGYINNLTENEGAKVITLANEKEIGLIDQAGLKSDNKENQKTHKISEERIQYEIAKEKAIGLTISYQVPLDEVYEAIAERYVKNQLVKLILERLKNQFINVFSYYQSNNLRVLIFTFLVCDKLYPILEEAFSVWKGIQRTDEKIRKLEREIFDSLTYDTFSYTLQACICDKLKKERFAAPRVFCGGASVFRYFGYQYPFIERFIKMRQMDKSGGICYIQGVLDDLFDQSQGRNKAYNQLMRWQLLEDTELKECLTEVKGEIVQKRLNPDYIRQLFIVLIYINSAGIPINMNEYVTCIYDNLIRNLPVYFLIEQLYIKNPMMDKIILQKYNVIMESIYQLLKQNIQEQRKKRYDFLIQNRWNLDFERSCKDNVTSFMGDGMFLAYIDVELLIDKIKKASSAEICYFTNGIKLVYEPVNIHEFYKADIPKIQEIIKEIKKLNDLQGCIKRKNVAVLEKSLQQALDKLNDNGE